MQAVRAAFELALWFAVRAAFVLAMLFALFFGLEFAADAQSSGFFATEGGQLTGYGIGLAAAVLGLLFFVALFRFISCAVSGFRAGIDNGHNHD